MGPALERLLASPSAIRLLRHLVKHEHSLPLLLPASPPWNSGRHNGRPSCLKPSTPHAACSRRSIATLRQAPQHAATPRKKGHHLVDVDELSPLAIAEGLGSVANAKERSPTTNAQKSSLITNTEKSSSAANANNKKSSSTSNAKPLGHTLGHRGRCRPSANANNDKSRLIPGQDASGYLSLQSCRAASPSRRDKDPFDALMHEADIATGSNGPRLVDHPDHAQDMQLWLKLLRFRKRLHGHGGVRSVWSAMMLRKVDLPVTGPIADALWSTFINAALTDVPLMHSIYGHAKHLKQNKAGERPGLYRDIVGGYLRTNPTVALPWHHLMQEGEMVPPNAAVVVFPLVVHSRHAKKAHMVFKKLYSLTAASGIYDICMAEVCDTADFATAYRWHGFFTKRDDQPSPEMLTRPLIRYLFVHTLLPDRQLHPLKLSARRELAAHYMSFDHTLEHQPSPPHNKVHNVADKAHIAKKKTMGDAFCARLFATGAFSVELVTTGLRMLGLEQIGSLALREIAARSPHPSDYLSTIQSFEMSGITVVDSTFSRALKKFAEDGNADYFDVVVRSDQHPDMYDDPRVQKKLFASFLNAGELVQAHATLAILTISEPDSDQYTWNLLFQTYCKTSDHSHLLQILHEMRHKGVALESRSIDAILGRSIQPERKDIHSDQAAINLDFVTNVFLDLLRNGQEVYPHRWREILRLYGMTNRLLALERLLLWLAMLYPAQEHWKSVSILVPQTLLQSESPSLSMPTELTLQPRARIFSPGLLRALIAWGFISANRSRRNESETQDQLPDLPIPPPITTDNNREVVPQRWARGIAILRKLRDCGVDMTHTSIRREVKTRLWMLVGPGRSATRHGRLAQRLNRKALTHYVKHINEIWGKDFFKMPGDRLRQVSSAESLTFTAIFGHRRRYGFHRDGIDGSNNVRRNRLRLGREATSDDQSSKERPEVLSTNVRTGR